MIDAVRSQAGIRADIDPFFKNTNALVAKQSVNGISKLSCKNQQIFLLVGRLRKRPWVLKSSRSSSEAALSASVDDQSCARRKISESTLLAPFVQGET